jgi:lipopolysaccharide biosynthesis glycosyltransferase
MHCPEIPIGLFYQPAKDGFLTWVQKCPQVDLQAEHLEGYGWNIKPKAIMHMLDQGFAEVIWIDSDIIVNENILTLLSCLESNTLVATEHTLAVERCDRDARRARLWGLPVGRVLPFALNSGVLRVTKEHYRLMERWWSLLQSDIYQDIQKKAWAERPVHMLGDQDVLTALLTSKEFSDISLCILRRGKHIIQFDGVYGYTVLDRLTNLAGYSPTFIHSMAGKPWSEQWGSPAKAPKEYLKSLYLDISPYTLLASRFRSELDCNTEWMEPHYVLSRILRSAGMGYPALVGMPIAVGADLVRAAKYIWKYLQSILYPMETETERALGKQ